jgi:hypothetical protein
MNIIEAIKLANNKGRKIRRSFWADYHWIEICRRDREIEDIRCNRFPFIDENGFVGSYFTIEAMLANDWEIYKEEPKLHSFEEAIASLRKGESIKRKSWTNRFSVDANDNHYNFSINDINANDWIIKDN